MIGCIKIQAFTFILENTKPYALYTLYMYGNTSL